MKSPAICPTILSKPMPAVSEEIQFAHMQKQIYQAILSKVIPASPTKPTRVKATCARGSYTMNYDSERGLTENHIACVQYLVSRFATEDYSKNGVDMNKNTWCKPRVVGQLPNGDYCHVFTA